MVNLGVKVLFTLGIINVLTGLLILFTCRCVPGLKAFMGKPAYKRLYSYHCYIWWVFWGSVMVHAILAVTVIGIPF